MSLPVETTINAVAGTTVVIDVTGITIDGVAPDGGIGSWTFRCLFKRRYNQLDADAVIALTSPSGGGSGITINPAGLPTNSVRLTIQPTATDVYANGGLTTLVGDLKAYDTASNEYPVARFLLKLSPSAVLA
jgi:hypothetical protein